MRDRLTPEDLRRNFDRELTSVTTGGGLTTGTGLDDETERALWAIADAHPEIPDALIQTARDTFEAQLDGSHAAARMSDLARRIDEINRR
ncbi:hypothetical protein [Nocardia alni]|uniref:hypothetical protein n=1 Tax=Nocardia alni TaxID=2815723 RepID=UPI001C2301B2|nr:hypothetical protein [Nocardia alni]